MLHIEQEVAHVAVFHHVFLAFDAEFAGFFDRFFAYVARSDFLTGRNGKWQGCDLGWLVKAANFAKVVSGNYEAREDA